MAGRDQGNDSLEHVRGRALLGRDGGRDGGRGNCGCSHGWWVVLLMFSGEGVERVGGRAGGREYSLFNDLFSTV